MASAAHCPLLGCERQLVGSRTRGKNLRQARVRDYLYYATKIWLTLTLKSDESSLLDVAKQFDFISPVRMEPGTRQGEPTHLESPKQGGLKLLERLLGLRNDNIVSTDAVFVSLDLEVDADRQKLHLLTEEPVVRQLGFASLDTRDIHASSLHQHNLRSLISAQMFQTTPKP
ncbi:Uu.00g033670.m01.CDS01 [Anthostomella pinea]|uniref:Uu.00g033670.m01.CDS01 n=1 Tax=Anthostomella pinea TaxID=933095 RepID=A0AAI8V8R9_9PEZI|nr:Uu.00g033670.m01.CDS01 [Anthostomella pinea]